MYLLKLFFIFSLTPHSSWSLSCKSLFEHQKELYTVEENEIRPLLSSPEIKTTLIEMINRAQNNVLIETRSIRDRYLTDALISALQRGVDVEIYVSEIAKQRNGAATKKDSIQFFTRLKKAGAVIHEFPVKRLNRVSKYLGVEHHRKSLIVDTHEAYIGSSNLRFDDSFETGLYLKGSYARVLTHDRNLLLHRFNNIPLPTSSPTEDPSHSKQIKHLSSRYTRDSISEEVQKLFDGAKTSITIATTNLSDSNLIDHLINIKSRNPQIRIQVLLSSHSKRFNFKGLNFQWKDHAYVHRMLKGSGIELRQYKGPDISHSKVLVVDGIFLLLGSYDLSSRSLYGNLENALLIDDRDIAAVFEERILSHFRNGDGNISFSTRLTYATLALRVSIKLIENLKKQTNYIRKQAQAYSNNIYRRIFIRKRIGTLYRFFQDSKKASPVQPYNLDSDHAFSKAKDEFKKDHETYQVKSYQQDTSCSNCIYLYGGYRKNIAEQIFNRVPFLSENGFFGRGLYMSSHPRTAKDYSNIRLHNTSEPRSNVVVFTVSQDKVFNMSDQNSVRKQFENSNFDNFNTYLQSLGFEVIRYQNIEGFGYDYYIALDSSKVTPLHLIQSIN